MTRRDGTFSAIRSEGGLLPADLLARVTANDKTLAGIGPEAYHLAPGERISEAITRSWNRLVGAWSAFTESLERLPADEKTATNITRSRWSLVLFQELGYGQLQAARGEFSVGAKAYPISHAWGPIPVHLPGARVAIDKRTAGVAGAAAMSPHGLVQELLNRSDGHLWGFVCNGLQLRLLRDNVSLTRPAYLEFDLEKIFTGQAYHEFVVLWLVCHQSRVEGDIPQKSILEQWVADAADRGTRALDQLRVGVETAITELGAGFLSHRANAALKDKLRSGELDKRDYQRQLLRLVYRLIFLLVAESRELLLRPDADATTVERYRDFYSLSRLRGLAETRRGTAHGDLWQSLLVVMRALGSPKGEPALGLPSLGSFLWSERATPELDAAAIENRRLLAAIRALSLVREGSVVRTVDYRNLGAEELGSIYESLLELHPDLDVDAGTFSLTTAAGNERKTTGSYYTPTSLINELLDSALEPVLDEAVAADDPDAALLAVTVLDPACGSGHFLIAAAHRIARRLASVRTGEGEPSPEATRSALRDVVGRCIHGIDVNEMAVELCKVSLWMEAVEPGKPLSFLEHRIVHGNSLLGATPRLLADGVPDEAFKALEGDDKATVTALKRRNKEERKRRTQLAFDFGSVIDLARPVTKAIQDIDAIDEDDVAAKERRWQEFVASDEREHARLAADAWCAAFVAPKTPGAPAITDEVVRAIARDPASVKPDVLHVVRQLRSQYGFLHLHLAFPHVFQAPADGVASENQEMGWSGGFSAVLGNPPWERVKLQEKEFFAERAPEIAAAPSAAARKRLIARLKEQDPALDAAFGAAVRHAEGESHLLRSSGRYPLCGRGDVNTYAVFAEGMRAAIAPYGRAGIIVPSGIATDDTTKHFFADLVHQSSLVSLFDFENRLGIFPAVDSRMKFSLLTLTGNARPAGAAEFVFFAHAPADLSDGDRRFSLIAEDLALLNPNTHTCPTFRSRRDATLTRAIHDRVPVLLQRSARGEESGNPWGVQFLRMFDMSNDSHLFETAEDLEAHGYGRSGATFSNGHRWLPLYEAKMFHHFDHRWASYDEEAEGEDPCAVAVGRYWVREDAVSERCDLSVPLLGWRRVARSTDERTLIASLLPHGACGDSVFLALPREPAFLLAALFSSYVLDYVARQKVGGTNLSYFLVEQFPVLAPHNFDSRLLPQVSIRSWVLERVRELSYTAWDINPADVELEDHAPPFRWIDERRLLLRAELDACFFHLYGIERDDVDYIMETFPIVKRKDEAAHGEYRTKRLILECYDAMAKAIGTGEPYQTILDPPPADPSLCHPESTRPDWAKA